MSSSSLRSSLYLTKLASTWALDIYPCSKGAMLSCYPAITANIKQTRYLAPLLGACSKYLGMVALIISNRGPKLVMMFYEHPIHLASTSTSLPLNRFEVWLNISKWPYLSVISRCPPVA